MPDYDENTWIDDDGSSTTGTQVSADLMNNLEAGVKDAAEHHKEGILADRPPAGADNKNWLYFATDTRQVFFSRGSHWQDVTPSSITVAGFSGMPTLTGRNYVEFQASGSASVAVQDLGGGSARVLFSASGSRGPQGAKGDTGDTGPQGDPGDTGPQGDPGPPGASGATGTQGPPGSAGASATLAVGGSAGVPTLVGKSYLEFRASGSASVAVQDMPNGSAAILISASGTRGPQGAPGADGAPGASGAPGAAGASGATGATGASATLAVGQPWRYGKHAVEFQASGVASVATVDQANGSAVVMIHAPASGGAGPPISTTQDDVTVVAPTRKLKFAASASANVAVTDLGGGSAQVLIGTMIRPTVMPNSAGAYPGVLGSGDCFVTGKGTQGVGISSGRALMPHWDNDDLFRLFLEGPNTLFASPAPGIGQERFDQVILYLLTGGAAADEGVPDFSLDLEFCKGTVQTAGLITFANRLGAMTDDAITALKGTRNWIRLADCLTRRSGSNPSVAVADVRDMRPLGKTLVVQASDLPKAPYDGQAIQFLADAANGVIWDLVYQKYDNKWHYAGGPPLYEEQATSSTTASTTYANLAATVGPTVTVPLAGDYMVEIGCQAGNATAGNVALMSYAIGAAAASDNDLVRSISSTAAQPTSIARETKKTLAALTALVGKYRVGGGTGSFAFRWMAVTPVALSA